MRTRTSGGVGGARVSLAPTRSTIGVCNALSEREIEQFWHRWEALLPSPFTPEDRLRGYGYALSVRQLEISDGGDRISRA